MKRIYIVSLVKNTRVAIYSGLHEDSSVAKMAARLEFPQHVVLDYKPLADNFVLAAAAELTGDLL